MISSKFVNITKLTALGITLAFSLGTASHADNTQDYEGEFILSVDDEGESYLKADFSLLVSELSVTNYIYGAKMSFHSDNLFEEDLSADSYLMYFGKSSWQIQISNDLAVSTVSDTSLAMGEGLLGNWQALQPISGDAAYVGAFTDEDGEGDVGLLFNINRDTSNLNFGFGEKGLVEADLGFDTNFGNFTLSLSGGEGNNTSYAVGAGFEFGSTSIDLSQAKTSSLGKESFGAKIARDFSNWTLIASFGRASGGVLNDFREASAIAANFFVGESTVLSLGVGTFDKIGIGSGTRSYFSYNQQVGIFEVIGNLGRTSGSVDETELEAGIRFAF